MLKHKLVDFIIQFMEEVDKEISEMKLFVSLPPVDFSLLLLTCTKVECQSPVCGRVVPDTGMKSFLFRSFIVMWLTKCSSTRDAPGRYSTRTHARKERHQRHAVSEGLRESRQRCEVEPAYATMTASLPALP